MSVQEDQINGKILDYPGRVPPQATEVEEAILGAILIDEAAFTSIMDFLDESCFYKESHRIIYGVMKTLYLRSEPIDALTVTEELRRSNQLERIGGAYFITGLTNKVPSASNIATYTKIVLDKSRLRKLITVGGQIVNMAFQETEDVDTLIDTVEKQIFDIAQDKASQQFRPLNAILHDAFEQMDNYYNRPGGLTGVPSGFQSIDHITNGFQASNLIIVAARPGMGKTALVLNVARHAAVLHQKAVGIFSLEMSSTDLVTRLLCAEAEVDAQRLRSGNLPDKDYRKLHTSVNNLHKANIFIDETAGLNILDLRARARRLKAEHNVELLIIDYLQLINASVRSGANRQEEVALISRSLKALAKELSIPVIALSQLSRAVEQRGGDKRPQLSDLRDSGSIEQDADVVMFIHREDYYNTAQDSFNQSMVTEAEIIIAKHRNGPTDTAKLGWARKFTKFVPMDTAHAGIVPPPSSHDVEPAF